MITQKGPKKSPLGRQDVSEAPRALGHEVTRRSQHSSQITTRLIKREVFMHIVFTAPNEQRRYRRVGATIFLLQQAPGQGHHGGQILGAMQESQGLGLGWHI